MGCTAITSPSYGSLLLGLGRVLADQNKEVAFCDQDGKGYPLLTMTHRAADVDFVTVSTIRERAFDRRIAARYRKAAGLTRAPISPS